jgi:hypothetical protein
MSMWPPGAMVISRRRSTRHCRTLKSPPEGLVAEAVHRRDPSVACGAINRIRRMARQPLGLRHYRQMMGPGRSDTADGGMARVIVAIRAAGDLDGQRHDSCIAALEALNHQRGRGEYQ